MTITRETIEDRLNRLRAQEEGLTQQLQAMEAEMVRMRALLDATMGARQEAEYWLSVLQDTMAGSDAEGD